MTTTIEAPLTELQHIEKISRELGLEKWQVLATAALLDDGATVPFISRYRKEVTGSLDEVAITSIRDLLARLRELSKRQEAILASLEERELLTEELKTQVLAAETMAVLEDVYLPYRPKRRTRATIAKERGLEPLAQLLWNQNIDDFLTAAQSYIDPEKGVNSVEDALAGARDIIAEMVSEDANARGRTRELFLSKGTLKTKVTPGKEAEAAKYQDYFDWEEPLDKAPSHRVLAMLRADEESVLSLHIGPPEEEALAILDRMFIKGTGPASEMVRTAVQDGYKRLLAPSIETETRNSIKERADRVAIQVFADNLRQLLLAPPLGQKKLLAIDPGIRTGCKVVCMDQQGGLLHHDVIYLHHGERRSDEGAKVILALCKHFQIEAIAVGNGTGGREAEAFVRSLDLDKAIPLVMVNESGASVYSASDVARDEFPDQDVTVRGAVSIGRRLMDPLAELVKIDPKSIGVGQYQHDVDQKRLKGSLDDTVISCVNAVGVDVNTASKQLLSYVSGLGPQLAKAILDYRNHNGPFKSRKELTKVPRFGPKAFEQAAGFLRIRNGKHPLDNSAVHPESYDIVEAMAGSLDCEVEDLVRDVGLRGKINLKDYVNGKVGLPTLNDIMEELAKPGRDPRPQFENFSFDENVKEIKDLKPGMRLPGMVTNVTAFGAFVDVGVHQDGLVHISQLSDRFTKDPNEVVKVHQRVTVTVLNVDVERRRIALSMKSQPDVSG
ncbi:MAG: RNA-binding transcriptional accessory protein [Dehalococcoidia bacterium]|nr:RNA-binding transcriptional accessory protein [Dehalococcoidia bacterium]